MKRFDLYILALNHIKNESDWYVCNSYKTNRASEQALSDLRKTYKNRKWKIVDRSDNGVSYF